MTGTSATAVRPTEPPSSAARRRRLSDYRPATAHVVMLVAGVLAFALTLAALRDGAVTVDVAAAAGDLVAGSAIAETDLAVQRVEVMSADHLGRLLTVDEARELIASGARPTRPVPAGALLGVRDLAVEPVAAPRAISFPVDRTHAVGGALVPGDEIDLVSVDGGIARYVLTATPVLQVSEPASTGRSFWLTVGVDAEGVLRLSQAVSAGSLYVVRSTWAAPIAPELMELLPVGGEHPDGTGGGANG